MSHESDPRSVERLKQEAKRWLRALRANDPEAHARLARALPAPPPAPTLRDVQHALAREHGYAGWTALTAAAERGRDALARYEAMVDALLDAYRTGTPEAMERLYRYVSHRRAWPAMRTYVQLDLGKRPHAPDADVDITRDDARLIVAKGHGFGSWNALVADVRAAAPGARRAAKPVRIGDAAARDWDTILRTLAASPHARLHAEGQMTDGVLADVAAVEGITSLDLSGSQALTDDGLRHLARVPTLRHLDVSGTAVTDRGLAVLRDLPALETLSLAMTRVTDAGCAALAACDALRDVNLMWTRAGDGALRALAGKTRLRHLATGTEVTDDGLAALREIPAFATWQGGAVEMGLVSYRAAPNQLTLRGRVTDRGMRHLRALDGLFGLNLDDAALALTAEAMVPLVDLPHLGWLAVDATDDWMPHLAAMPQLRFLGAQDTAASDDGFVALARSRSIEYFWGRRCHGLGTRGFRALSRMPALRGLAASCLHVGDAGLATLPDFPALRELMPIDVPDAGYRHIAGCTSLEALVLMYCRDTTDAATEWITGLSRLASYFNSYTTITDRTPALLSTMASLERVTFDGCHALTDAGVAALARLPRLRELRVSGRGITAAVAAPFGAHVRVHASG